MAPNEYPHTIFPTCTRNLDRSSLSSQTIIQPCHAKYIAWMETKNCWVSVGSIGAWKYPMCFHTGYRIPNGEHGTISRNGKDSIEQGTHYASHIHRIWVWYREQMEPASSFVRRRNEDEWHILQHYCFHENSASQSWLETLSRWNQLPDRIARFFSPWNRRNRK